jgi:hypothetical protein
MVGGIVDNKMVAAKEGSVFEAKIKGGFGGITISHEEAGGSFGSKLVLISGKDGANGAEDVKRGDIWTLVVDQKIGRFFVTGSDEATFDEGDIGKGEAPKLSEGKVRGEIVGG